MARPPLPDYPWDSVAPYRERASAHPGGIVDLSVGSPVDPTPEVVRRALAEATEAHGYPTTQGTEELRSAISDWFARRRGVPDLALDAVIPTIGSKEAVALLPVMLGLGPGDVVVHPAAAYPSYALGAALVGATAVPADTPDAWPERTALVWVNSPGNPDGRVLDLPELRAIVAAARERGAVVVGDECYAELGWEEPWERRTIPSVLDPAVSGAGHDGVLALYSLSKQSNMAGYRAAFAAGDRSLVHRLLTVRKHAGLMVPAPLQHAMAVALRDDDHVFRQRELYRARRQMLRPALDAAGLRVDGSEAGLYLWVTEGRPAFETLERLARRGILGGPGIFYGEGGARHVRLSLTAPTERVAEAARRLGQPSELEVSAKGSPSRLRVETVGEGGR